MIRSFKQEAGKLLKARTFVLSLLEVYRQTQGVLRSMKRVKYIDDQRLIPQTNYQRWGDLLEYWGDFTDVRSELAPGVLILKIHAFLERKKSNLPTDRIFTVRSSVVIVDIECVESIRLNIREHRSTKSHS